MNRNGTSTRDERLSIRVTSALKKAVERSAAKDRRTVADWVTLMLEKATRRQARKDGDKRP
jgi:uncharacterized protein (DUF1778 family)